MEQPFSEGEITFDGQPKAKKSTEWESSKKVNTDFLIDLEALLESGDDDAVWVYFGVGGPA